MLYDTARHETLQPIPWNDAVARDAIARIASNAEAQRLPGGGWPPHPLDLDPGEPRAPIPPLYYGACGVLWALHHLQAAGAVMLARSYADDVAALPPQLRAWLGDAVSADSGSWLMGVTSALMLRHGLTPSEACAAEIEALIAGNMRNPARELMWGAPGTMLAALFMHQHTGEARWADLFRATASTLWSQLLWSDAHQCHYWTQDMYGQCSTYLDGVHGFVATASPLIRGRHLLADSEWAAWHDCIVNTVTRTATREGGLANWRAWLDAPAGRPVKWLMQFCHGAPGFVICLGGFPGNELDELLAAAGEAIWAAGPLTKGSNLCHGTGGNGFAFLTLYQRTRDPVWLARARAYAMHGIAQTDDATTRYGGQMRHSLWTGDIGFALYLLNCLDGSAAFPTLDVFFPVADRPTT